MLLSNGGSGGGHETCTLWPPPAPFGHFPARGKYLVRPQAGETSHKKQISCERQETGLPFFLPYHKGFRLCGGDQGAFRSPPGPLRGPLFLVDGRNLSQETVSLQQAGNGPTFLFPASQRVSPLRRRPKGFPIALWKPSAPCCNANRNLHKKQFPCKKQKTCLPQSPPINANSHGGHSLHRGHIVFITFSPEQRSPVPAPPGPESPGQYQIHIPPGPAARASRNRCLPRKRPPHHWRRRNRPCTAYPCIR